MIGSKGKVEESDLPQFQYLKLVVIETLRLHPPAALLLPRELMQHYKINGYDIYPNTRASVTVWGIGRDKYVLENPEKFSPDRFMGISTTRDSASNIYPLVEVEGCVQGCKWES